MSIKYVLGFGKRSLTISPQRNALLSEETRLIVRLDYKGCGTRELAHLLLSIQGRLSPYTPAAKAILKRSLPATCVGLLLVLDGRHIGRK